MSDQSQTDGAPEVETTQEETQPDSPPEWLGPIQERMSELGESTSRMADQLSALYAEPADKPSPEDDIEMYDDAGDLTPEGAQALIDRRVDERLQSVLSERDAATALDQRDDAFEALREEIPALQDDKLASRLVRETANYLVEHGRSELVETPMFVDMVEDRYYREQHAERAAAEREAAPGREVVLESASGATQPQSDEPDWGKRIVDAADRLRPQI